MFQRQPLRELDNPIHGSRDVFGKAPIHLDAKETELPADVVSSPATGAASAAGKEGLHGHPVPRF
jgi:hypothetical protein